MKNKELKFIITRVFKDDIFLGYEVIIKTDMLTQEYLVNTDHDVTQLVKKMVDKYSIKN